MPQQTAFDLPIPEVKGYIGDLMSQIGEEVTIDGLPSKVMLADIERAYTNVQQNSKKTVFLYDSIVEKGSRVIFSDGRVGLVFTTPNDDIVSKSADVLICNAKPTVKRYETVYDNDPSSSTFGDILTSGLIDKGQFYGFIERVSAREKQYDVGLLHDTVLRYFTFVDGDIELGDIVDYKGKRYRVLDIDNIVEGMLVVQLESVRSD